MENLKAKMMKEFQVYINAMTKDLMSKYEASLDALISSGEDAPEPSVEVNEVKETKKKSPAKKAKKEEVVEPVEEPKEVKKKSPAKKAKKEEEEKISIPFEETQSDLVGAKKDQLAVWCKKYGLKSTGKVDELMSRLIDYKKEHPPVNDKEEETVTKPTPVRSLLQRGGLLNGVKSTPKKSAPAPVQTPVMKKFLANKPNYVLSRNKFGNYEDPKTGLVFDKDDKIVIGKQDASGTILDLTDEDIEACKQYKYNYRLPENLDAHKKGLKHVKVEEVEEELNEDDLGEDFSGDEGAEEDEFVDEE